MSTAPAATPAPSASRAARAVAAGATTAEALARAALARIAEREPAIGAWRHIDPDRVLDEAAARDRRPGHGALHGVPVALPDLPPILPSSGSGDGREGASAEIALAGALRAAGAVPLGRTLSGPGGLPFPARTRNPYSPALGVGSATPGAVAAVADGHVAMAVGLDGVGALAVAAIRARVAAFAPTAGLVPDAGVALPAPSLDTLAVLARALDDLSLFLAAAARRADRRVSAPVAPRLAVLGASPWGAADDDAAARLVRIATEAGATARPLALPERFRAMDRVHAALAGGEAGAPARHGPADPAGGAEAAAARAEAAALRIAFDAATRDVDAVVVAVAASAPSEDRIDLPAEAAWSVLRGPRLALPLERPEGPAGLLLIGRRHEDAALIALARLLALGPPATRAA